MKKSILIVAVAVALSLVAALAAVKLTSPSASSPPKVAAATPTPVNEPGMIYTVSERVLNLVPSGGVPHYARIELAIEFQRPPGTKPPKAVPGEKKSTAPPAEPGLDPVVAHKVQIEDAVVRVVGSKTLDA